MKPLTVGVTGLAAGLGLQCYMFRRLPELYRIKWLCDLDAEKVRRGVADYGGEGTQEFENLLRDPEVDLVTIATPVTTHAALARKALAAGKHVLLEKPIAATVAEADELVAAAKSAEGVLCIGHQRRFMANQRLVEEVVSSGELGQILSMRLDFPVNDVRGADLPVNPATWQARFMSGHVYDYMVHHADQICRVLNQKPLQVHGRYVTLHDGDLPCEMQIMMTMPSGVLASINLCYSHAPEFKWQINGVNGSLRIDSGNDMGACRLYRRQPDGSMVVRELQRPHLKNTVDALTGAWRPKNGTELHGYTDQDPHMEFYRHLFIAITGGQPVPAPAEDARDAIKIIWLAVESARTGQVLNWL